MVRRQSYPAKERMKVSFIIELFFWKSFSIKRHFISILRRLNEKKTSNIDLLYGSHLMLHKYFKIVTKKTIEVSLYQLNEAP